MRLGEPLYLTGDIEEAAKAEQESQQQDSLITNTDEEKEEGVN